MGTAFALIGAAVGCFGPNLEREFRCSDRLCPPGLTCASDMVCREPGNGGSDGGADLDAVVGGDFGPGVLVTGIAGVAADPEISFDGLELYYRRGEAEAQTDIMVVRRMSEGQPWSSPVPVSAINSNEGELDPRLSSDGLTIYFSRGDVESSDVHTSRRNSTNDLADSWVVPRRIAELAGGGANFSFAVSGDERSAVFTSTRAGDVDLFRATNNAAMWLDIEPLDELNESDSFDGSSELSADGLTLYFDSDRSGQRLIYVATRASVMTEFSAPVRLDGIGIAEDASISADANTIYFSSERDGRRRLYNKHKAVG